MIVLVVLTDQAVHAADFDTSRDCPVRDPSIPCSCKVVPSAGVRDIECSNKNFVALPAFLASNFPFIGLRLGQNFLTSIGSGAFSNLNFTELYLNDNNISYLDNETFTNLQGQITLLDLRNNQLTTLPTCLAKLTGINFLDVSYNPIHHTGFIDSIMRQMGDYIHEFRFGSPELQEWPASMHHLQALQILKFYGGKMERINMTAFNGFEWTLRKLWIQNTYLISVPMALQRLHSVEELHFDNNVFVKDAGILIPAFAGISSKVEVMSLENNSLTIFPRVLQTLRQLHNLSLARNNLEFISDQTVSVVGSNLTTLNLVDCNLDRIPGALSRLSNLINLDLSNNSITTIEKTDLQRMQQLQSLNVSFNPLLYVSSQTFGDLRGLRELIMQETILYLVPEAIRNIPHLRTLDLSSAKPSIECTCDLSWLTCTMDARNATATPLEVLGECETIRMEINAYAKNRIRDVCPLECHSP